MKRNGWKEAVALAVCACTLAGTAATAQVSIGSSSNAVQSPLSSSSGYAIGHDRVGPDGLSAVGSTSESEVASSSDDVATAFVVNRFGYKDGEIVAFGRFVPVLDSDLDEELNAAGTTGVTGGVSRSGVLLSTPIEPAGGYGSDPRLGMGSRIAYSDVGTSGSVSLGSAGSVGASIGTSTSLGVSGSTTFDGSGLGSWTGIGTGYGESGVESRSNMTHDIDGTTSFNLGRPYDDQSYMEDITWSGSTSLEHHLAFSEDQEMLGDLELDAMTGSSIGADLSVSSTSSLDEGTLISLREDRPLVQLGGSQTLYSSAEAERAMMLMSSEDLPVPVTVVGASCDAVTLSFGGVEDVTISSLSGDEKLGSTLCALSEAASTPVSEGRSAMLVKQLNRLISRVR